MTNTIADWLTECDSAVDGADSACATPSVWYRTLDVTSQLIQYNRTMSKSTQRWWHVAHRNAVGSVLAQPAATVGDTLNYMINYLRNTVDRHVRGLSIADRNMICVYARGTHFDVGAIETLVYEVLGLLPATESTLAFQDALWFYRSARDARSHVHGLQDAYRNAMSDEGFAATEDVIKSNTNQARKYLNSLLAGAHAGSCRICPVPHTILCMMCSTTSCKSCIGSMFNRKRAHSFGLFFVPLDNFISYLT